MLMIHFVVESSTFVAESASEMAFKETLSKAPSMVRKMLRMSPFLAILHSILLATLCRAASVELPFLKLNCHLFRSVAMLRSCCMCHSSTFSWSLSNTQRVMVM